MNIKSMNKRPISQQISFSVINHLNMDINKVLKFNTLFLPIFLSLIAFSFASAPANELLLDRVYTADDSPGKFVNMSGYKIKRVNRTTFLVGGEVTLLQPLDDGMSVSLI